MPCGAGLGQQARRRLPLLPVFRSVRKMGEHRAELNFSGPVWAHPPCGRLACPCPLQWRNDDFDSNASDLVAGAGSPRAGCCSRDHGVLRSQSPWRCCGSSNASGCTGQPRSSRRCRLVRARASPSCRCRGRRLICSGGFGGVLQGQRCQQAQVQCLRFLLFRQRVPEFGAGCAGTRFHPLGILHRGAQRRHVRR